MSERLTKREFIEREMKVWKEKFDISFADEFKVEMLQELRYTYMNTQEDHIKTKNDIIETIMKLERSLNLKPRNVELELSMPEKEKIMIVVNNRGTQFEMSRLLEGLINKNELNFTFGKQFPTQFITSSKKINIELNSENSLRGKRCDTLLNLTGDSKVEDMVKRK